MNDMLLWVGRIAGVVGALLCAGAIVVRLGGVYWIAGYQVGKSYREIATELHCKTKSVDNALARIKRKVSTVPLGLANLSELLINSPLR